MNFTRLQTAYGIDHYDMNHGLMVSQSKKLVHFNEVIEVFVFESSTCCSSSETENNEFSNYLLTMKSCSQTNSTSMCKPKKSVQFNQAVQVFIIPSRNDFIMFISELWYRYYDFIRFEEEAYNEIQMLCNDKKSYQEDCNQIRSVTYCKIMAQ
jgi:hypothetical protein